MLYIDKAMTRKPFPFYRHYREYAAQAATAYSPTGDRYRPRSLLNRQRQLPLQSSLRYTADFYAEYENGWNHGYYRPEAFCFGIFLLRMRSYELSE